MEEQLPKLYICLPIIKDIVTIISLAIGSIVAIIGVSTWKRQLKGASNFDISKRFLFELYKLRDEVNGFRNFGAIYNVLKYLKEKQNSPGYRPEFLIEASKSYKPNYQEKLKNISNSMQNIEVLSVEAETLLGGKIRAAVLLVNKKIEELNNAFEEYIDFVTNENQDNYLSPVLPEDVEQLEKTLFEIANHNKSDLYKNEFLTGINSIEKILQPYLHR